MKMPERKYFEKPEESTYDPVQSLAVDICLIVGIALLKKDDPKQVMSDVKDQIAEFLKQRDKVVF